MQTAEWHFRWYFPKRCQASNLEAILGVNPKMVGFTQQTHGFFLQKMIMTWGVKWGYHHLRKHPNIRTGTWWSSWAMCFFFRGHKRCWFNQEIIFGGWWFWFKTVCSLFLSSRIWGLGEKNEKLIHILQVGWFNHQLYRGCFGILR